MVWVLAVGIRNRFLEVLSEAMGLKVEELGEISAKSKKKVKINSTCTVFGQQEVVARLSEGEQILPV